MLDSVWVRKFTLRNVVIVVHPRRGGRNVVIVVGGALSAPIYRFRENDSRGPIINSAAKNLKSMR